MRKRHAYLTVSLLLVESHVIIMHGLSHQAKVLRCKNGLGWVTAVWLRLPICPRGDGEELELLSNTIHHLVMFTYRPQALRMVLGTRQHHIQEYNRIFLDMQSLSPEEEFMACSCFKGSCTRWNYTAKFIWQSSARPIFFSSRNNISCSNISVLG